VLLAASIPAVPVGESLAQITGRILDQATGDLLSGANLVVQGTTLGAATDREGYFVISGTPLFTHGPPPCFSQITSSIARVSEIREFVMMGQTEEEVAVGRQRHTAEQIISKLREAEVLQGKRMSLEEVLRQPGISDATY
jgi:hypothetical protein